MAKSPTLMTQAPGSLILLPLLSTSASFSVCTGWPSIVSTPSPESMISCRVLSCAAVMAWWASFGPVCAVAFEMRTVKLRRGYVATRARRPRIPEFCPANLVAFAWVEGFEFFQELQRLQGVQRMVGA